MDLTLERDQESGQLEARCVSYHMFKLKYHSKYVSCLFFKKAQLKSILFLLLFKKMNMSYKNFFITGQRYC